MVFFFAIKTIFIFIHLNISFFSLTDSRVQILTEKVSTIQSFWSLFSIPKNVCSRIYRKSSRVYWRHFTVIFLHVLYTREEFNLFFFSFFHCTVSCVGIINWVGHSFPTELKCHLSYKSHTTLGLFLHNASVEKEFSLIVLKALLEVSHKFLRKLG